MGKGGELRLGKVQGRQMGRVKGVKRWRHMCGLWAGKWEVMVRRGGELRVEKGGGLVWVKQEGYGWEKGEVYGGKR